MNDLIDGPVTVHVGDALSVLRELPSESVHCVVTSPPYWGLRDYGVSEQLGLEPTPQEYVAKMVAVFAEVRRVLRREGTCWLNIGDSFIAGGNGARDPEKWPKQSRNANGFRSVHAKARSGLKRKDLALVPERLAIALQDEGWWVRQRIAWCKTAPMPESVDDRPASAWEHVWLLTKAERYFYDAFAVRELDAGTDHPRHVLHRPEPSGGVFPPHNGIRRVEGRSGTGRNMRNYWLLGPEPYPEAHFATFPEDLVIPCIKVGTSEPGVCAECGAPWERLVARSDEPHDAAKGSYFDRGKTGVNGQGRVQEGKRFKQVVAGWRSTCLHDAEPIPAIVLDPFVGSGTTLAVARRLSRREVGIELQADYLSLIQKRVEAGALPLLELISEEGQTKK